MAGETKQAEETVFGTRNLGLFIIQAMAAVGASQTDAEYMARHLLASELAGHASHGLRRLPEYVDRAADGITDAAASAVIEKDAGALVAMDGNRTFGHFALRDAMELAVARSKEHGISAVTVRNSDFAGRFAPFCEDAAEQGVISLVFGNNNGSLQSVLPPGATQPRLSTNPIAAGVPRASAPHIVIDFATSMVASGRLHHDRDRDGATPAEWTGAGGFLKPFGGFKGFGLSLLVEALGGALSGSNTVSGRESVEAQGTLIIAIDVAQLRDLEDYTAQVEEFIAHVKDVELEDGAGPVRAPGENAPSADQMAADTAITLNSVTVENLSRIAARLGLQAPERR